MPQKVLEFVPRKSVHGPVVSALVAHLMSRVSWIVLGVQSRKQTSSNRVHRTLCRIHDEEEASGSDGSGDDLGMFMTCDCCQRRVGGRIGNGMTSGTMCQRHVGNNAGCGMRGGMIVIEGRCPTPPQGTQLRPLTGRIRPSMRK